MIRAPLDVTNLPIISDEDDDATFWEKAAAYGFVRPKKINRDQAWFWTRKWITGEIEAEIDIAEGRTTFYASTEEFLAALEERDTHPAEPEDEPSRLEGGHTITSGA